MHKLTEISAELVRSTDAMQQIGSCIKVSLALTVATLALALALLPLV